MTATLEANRSRQVEMILASVDALPTLSPVATRLLSLGASDEVDIEEITKVIEGDVAMASRVLSMCRKADKGLGDRITSVKRAIVMLGIEAIRAAALSVNIYDVMEQGKARREALDRMGFWRFSIATAWRARRSGGEVLHWACAVRRGVRRGALALLGQGCAGPCAPQELCEAISVLAERQGSDTAPSERSLVGVDHHTAGKRVAEHWHLPEAVRG